MFFHADRSTATKRFSASPVIQKKRSFHTWQIRNARENAVSGKFSGNAATGAIHSLQFSRDAHARNDTV